MYTNVKRLFFKLISIEILLILLICGCKHKPAADKQNTDANSQPDTNTVNCNTPADTNKNGLFIPAGQWPTIRVSEPNTKPEPNTVNTD